LQQIFYVNRVAKETSRSETTEIPLWQAAGSPQHKPGRRGSSAAIFNRQRSHPP
jgi:hypothetical protein